ncbi:FAD-binding domain-containing protein [Metschnikowia bicuspidata var. bicuspidata NRRL YB-4993]|uniref:D-lactate dehydrogenase (cytochrome) n=1 Tax=Metschnikowia bicuspidata var. bicuspidata NRRL YB-4993 TaxID=869754 RepID=A0A1A0HC78_9ASCO|nr:FAD-binding domain-containing protein [Metschnikowia bicuspidata var. bicuspidata NRRL YB-4993]OBA21734.1 FAD-binding domain-containing protein [Metschnikowia bicuspidata var. bicuspidata NRRL YB-4993]
MRYGLPLRNLQFTRGLSSRKPNQPVTSKRIWPSAIIFLAFVSVGAASYLYGKKQVHDNPPNDLFPFTSTTKLSHINSPKYCTDSELEKAIAEIKLIIGEKNVTNSEAEINGHFDNGFTTHPPKPHQRARWIIYGTSTNDVSEVMKILHKYSVPVVPYSGGSSLEGHFFSTRPGVILDTSKMDRILRVNRNDLDVELEAGVNWVKLNEELTDELLLFGCDCGSSGLIGGMVNTNASGVNASKYGAMIQNVISLTVVLADGTIIKTRQRPKKTSAGYNLTGLFIGSEGTLGIVTEATVRLHVKPQNETVVVGQFPTIFDTTQTVAELFRRGIRPEAIELLDKDMMHCINYSGYWTKEWLEVPTIFFKIGGLNQKVVGETLKVVKEVSLANNCKDFISAESKEEGDELFSARKDAFYAILNYGKNEIHEDVRLWVTDIAVPLSKLSSVLEQVRVLIEKSGFQSVILGHVGDGNFHADIFYTSETKKECEKLVNEMMLVGLANEGTSSGEHGIGNGKRKYLDLELGVDAVDTMRKVKMALDPKRIMNPDKVFKIDPKDDGEY